MPSQPQAGTDYEHGSFTSLQWKRACGKILTTTSLGVLSETILTSLGCTGVFLRGPVSA